MGLQPEAQWRLVWGKASASSGFQHGCGKRRDQTREHAITRRACVNPGPVNIPDPDSRERSKLRHIRRASVSSLYVDRTQVVCSVIAVIPVSQVDCFQIIDIDRDRAIVYSDHSRKEEALL